MEEVKNKTEQFCHDILALPVNRHRALANLGMWLSSGVALILSLLTDKTLPFGDCLCLEKADMGYAHASFLSPLYALVYLKIDGEQS